MRTTGKGRGLSVTAALLGGGLSILALIAFLIYGAVYSVYFDIVVLLCMALGAAGFVTYGSCDKKAAEFLGLGAVVCLSFGTGLFFLNSYPVWADWYGKFNMYGSQGGIAPVVVILVLLLAAITCGVVSCFRAKEAK